MKDDNTQGAPRFSFNANVSERDLEDYFYPPFEACISSTRGNSAGAMCSDAAQNGVPSCASELLMTQKPKDWNASDDFFVVSDMGSYYNVYAAHKYSANTSDALLTDMQAGLDILYLRSGPECRDTRSPAYSKDCPATAATSQQVRTWFRCLLAGGFIVIVVVGSADIVCSCSWFVQGWQCTCYCPPFLTLARNFLGIILRTHHQANETHDAFEAATNGSHPDSRFTLADLDIKAGVALRLRFDLGEFDPVDGNPYAQPIDASVIDGQAHRKVARDATAASIVLLQNKGSVLPLSKTAKVAAIGPWIKPSLQPAMGGNTNPYVHAYAGSSVTMVDFLDGLTAQLATPPVFVQGCESNQTSADDPTGTFSAAKQAAAAADVAVVAVGLTAGVWDQAGVGGEEEMRDRLSLNLPQVQLDLIAAVRSVAKKVVLIIVSGSAVTFNESDADATLYAMYGGEEAGNGLADVLFGGVSPSGRLPFTVFQDLAQIKPMSVYDMTTSPGRTHLYYSDGDVAKYGAPQFWFGYGLTYSSFSFSQLTVALAPSPRGSECTVAAAVTVTNHGTTAAREVAQLYLGRPTPAAAGLPFAKWALKGYQRTSILAPGTSTTLHFELNFHDLSTVQADAVRVVTAGAYSVQIGGGHPRDSRVPSTPVVGTVNIAASMCSQT